MNTLHYIHKTYHRPLIICQLFLLAATMVAQSDINPYILESQYIKALSLSIYGNNDASLKLLDSLRRVHPDNDVILYKMSQLQENQGKDTEAILWINKAIEINPSQYWYYVHQYHIYKKLNQAEKAISAAQKSIGLAPTRSDMYDELSEYYIDLNQIENAITLLLSKCSILGLTEKTAFKTIDLYQKAGNTEGAMDIIQQLLKKDPESLRYNKMATHILTKASRHEEALPYFQKIHIIDPYDVEAHLALNIYKGQKDGDNTRHAYISPLIEDTKVPIDIKIKELSSYMSDLSLSDTASWHQLTEWTNVLTQQYPKHPMVLAYCGDVYFNLLQLTVSRNYYAEAIKMGTTNYLIWKNYMTNLEALGDTETLEQVALQCIDLFPNQPHAYLKYAHALVEQKKQNKTATDYIEEAQLISAMHPDIVIEGQLIQARIANYLGHKKEALEMLKIISDQTKHPSYADIYELMGDIYYSIGEKDNAKKVWIIAQTVSLRPSIIQSKIDTLSSK